MDYLHKCYRNIDTTGGGGGWRNPETSEFPPPTEGNRTHKLTTTASMYTYSDFCVPVTECFTYTDSFLATTL